MNNYDDYCTKLYGEHSCTGEDCPNCRHAKIIAEHESELIDEVLKKVQFEENWLFDTYKENGSKYKSADVDIAFCGIKHFLEQLKEQMQK